MKLTTWLKKIWKTIQAIFSRIPEELKSAIHIGVVVTENIKTFVDSPAADILTILIPGETDDKVKTALRVALPPLLIRLKLADGCSNTSSPAEITACAIKVLQSLSGDIKSAFLHNLAILIAQVAADGKLSWQDATYVMEWYYQQQFKPVNNSISGS